MVLGSTASLLGAPVLEGFLFGISPPGRPTFVTSPFFMTAVAILAAAVPAIRAARVEPVAALREE